MIYVLKFSNGVYLINPNFAYGADSVEGIFTTDLNRARLFDDIATAERVAENLLGQRDSFPQAYKAITDGNYEIVTVTIIEVNEALDELEKRAQEYIEHAPKDWLKVIDRGSKFYSVTAELENTPEVRALGPTIAYVLKHQYDFYKATYHAEANCITAESKND